MSQTEISQGNSDTPKNPVKLRPMCMIIFVTDCCKNLGVGGKHRFYYDFSTIQFEVKISLNSQYTPNTWESQREFEINTTKSPILSGALDNWDLLRKYSCSPP